jgi:hypothetical protein
MHLAQTLDNRWDWSSDGTVRTSPKQRRSI